MNELIIILSISVIILSIIVCIFGIYAIITKREQLYQKKIIEFKKQKEDVNNKINKTKKDLYGK